VAVIRISGPDALHVWQRMVRAAQTNRGKVGPRPKLTHKPHLEPERNDRTPLPFLPEAWKLQRCHVVDPQTSELLDDALAVFFRGAPPRLPLKTSPFSLLTRESQLPARSPQRTF
jgi:tRNA modification GTPase